jgi:murein DD-endopeptidase MepM/ murein hydrolase activator NlpD
MPVPALARPGGYALEILGPGDAVLRRLTITVRDARFPKQDVQLGKAQQELKPAPGEMELVTGFRNLVTDTRYWAEPLAAPLPGCMVSRFGVQRYWNGKPTGNYHAGIDQRSPAGKPVRAVASGTVRIGRMLNVQGGTVGIDHGQGLESVYQHLSGFAAREGQRVEKGDVVGYVGSTGRSTAPHLHWSLYVNGVPVNPSQWMSLSPCGGGSALARKRRASS